MIARIWRPMGDITGQLAVFDSRQPMFAYDGSTAAMGTFHVEGKKAMEINNSQ